MVAFREDANNFQIFMKTLQALQSIKNTPPGLMSEQILAEKLANLQNFTKDMAKNMKNPYPKAFMSFLNGSESWFKDEKLNFFDLLAIICRFLT